MGWAARARQREIETGTTSIVKTWTSFKWEEDDDDEKASAQRKRRTEQLESAAKKMERYAAKVGLDMEVKLRKIKRQPQLCFEVTVIAADRESAISHAMTRIKRVLSVKVTPNRNPPRPSHMHGKTVPLPPQTRTLNPPWGKTEVMTVE